MYPGPPLPATVQGTEPAAGRRDRGAEPLRGDVHEPERGGVRHRADGPQPGRGADRGADGGERAGRVHADAAGELPRVTATLDGSPVRGDADGGGHRAEPEPDDRGAHAGGHAVAVGDAAEAPPRAPVADHLAPAEPQHMPARELEVKIALPVAREGSGLSWWARPSVSTTRRCSGQWKSTWCSPMCALTTGSGQAGATHESQEQPLQLACEWARARRRARPTGVAAGPFPGAPRIY